MGSVSAKVSARLVSGVKKFQPILEGAKARDVNESDTVTIVTDILAELLGFDKYSEITSEYAIKGTYVDLAIKKNGKPHLLVEVKAVGQVLEERHIKQAVDYGANEGVEWVVLTNGLRWQAYRVTFGRPITQELVLDIDLLGLNPRSPASVEALYPLTSEGISKSALDQTHEQRQATNPYVIAAVLLSEPVVDSIRREIRRMNPNVRIDEDAVRKILTSEVLKRDLVDGERAAEARSKVRRAASRSLRVLKPGETAEHTIEAQAPDSP